MPAAGQNDDKEIGKYRARLKVLLEMVTRPDGTVLPRDLFRTVLDFVMPMWDPLRRAGRAGRGQHQQEEEEEEEDKAAKSKCKGERVMYSRDECRSSTLLWRDGEREQKRGGVS